MTRVHGGGSRAEPVIGPADRVRYLAGLIAGSGRARRLAPRNDETRLQRVPITLNHLLGVMAGLVPAIHVFLAESRKKDVDARDNPRIKSGDGHDAEEAIRSQSERALI
jgi:hypothetical protein